MKNIQYLFASLFAGIPCCGCCNLFYLKENKKHIKKKYFQETSELFNLQKDILYKRKHSVNISHYGNLNQSKLVTYYFQSTETEFNPEFNLGVEVCGVNLPSPCWLPLNNS